MQINFRKFPVYTSIRKDAVMVQDISFVVSNGIYTNVPGIMALAVSMKIYTSDGAVDLTEAETAALGQWMRMFTGCIAESVIDYIDKVKGNERNE
jgi:hypothetical protein